jgi:hypothetical protein
MLIDSFVDGYHHAPLAFETLPGCDFSPGGEHRSARDFTEECCFQFLQLHTAAPVAQSFRLQLVVFGNRNTLKHMFTRVSE